MELTLESAFSLGGLVGHLSYLLLVVSMLMRVMWVLRLLVIASAFAAIAYDLIWLKDPVGVFWETLLVVVNITQLAITYRQNRRATFTPREAAFVHSAFPGLNNTLKRRLLAKGAWAEAAPGTELITAGAPVTHLIYIAEGTAQVTIAGGIVNQSGPGDFIGELTVLDAAPATGTVTATEALRYWAIEGEALRRLVAANDDINQAVSASFHRHMLTKLLAANAQILKLGGLPAGRLT